MSKNFFFDIDGTLADQEDILPSNQKALRELRLKGHTVMIASGRPAGYIRRMFSGLSDGFIAANGRRIEHEGNVLLDNSFTVAELKEIIKLCRVSQCSYCLLGDGVVYHGNPLYLYGHTRPYESIDVIHEDSWDIRDVRAYAFDIIYKDAAHLKTIKQNFDGNISLTTTLTAPPMSPAYPSTKDMLLPIRPVPSAFHRMTAMHSETETMTFTCLRPPVRQLPWKTQPGQRKKPQITSPAIIKRMEFSMP